ncbi:TetR family transcriptional regulator [Actinoplanes lobatus]|uniref:AcrR family transcriptional regulator n=1 Tax=Actinoplanes lobatus TaxID=113568 RepID=A0A7W7H8Y5_9ACTN|nr:TetR family transcriptional regulator [Actinoplanes lobatus]MBB4746215.1 AcrR family transcriptional regulator [Actinoplanes lobatus]GGN61276.1 TetR family transcriptional regulator [Actinoplanes lobatus]GIE41423.1 TetR family transcriptional regulator [Actinoplanes lobatus]
MTGDRLTKAAVAERALRLADEEGLEAVTVRRLAKELGVTPMALYWHFKNKDELFLGMVDHMLSGVRSDPRAGESWQKRLRAVVETVIGVMRAHPSLPTLLHSVDKTRTESFNRATNDTLALLTEAGFTVEEGFWVATYLLNGCIGIVGAQPGCPPGLPPEQEPEWRRQKRVQLEGMPAARFPMMIELAASYRDEPDMERYYAFCADLLLAAVESMAAARGSQHR